MSPEELSFRNLVEWHRDDLIKILNGTPASEVFTEYHHSQLIKNGVLCRVSNINRTLPTSEARALLENLSSEHTTKETKDR